MHGHGSGVIVRTNTFHADVLGSNPIPEKVTHDFEVLGHEQNVTY